MPITEDVASEAKMILEDEEIGTLEESPILFQLSGSNKELTCDGQLTDMSVSDETSTM